MANLSALTGLRIKSIQRGSVTFNAGNSGNITVSSVDTTKSVLFTTCRPAYAGDNSPGALGIGHSVFSTTIFAGARLTTNTNIAWLAGATMGNEVSGSGTLRWELVEYY